MRTQARGEPVPADTTPYGRFCSGKWPRSSSGTQLVAVGAAAENARTGRSCTTAGRPRRQRSPDLISTPLATSTQSCAADSRRSGAILSRSSLNLVQACRSRPRPAPTPASRQAGRPCGPVRSGPPRQSHEGDRNHRDATWALCSAAPRQTIPMVRAQNCLS